MADPYGLELSGLTPELSAEAAALARRQKVAEAMGMQAQQPLQTNRMAGGYVVPISPFEGAAQMLRAYSSRKGLEDVDAKRQDIARRGREAVTGEIARIRGIEEGTPGSTWTGMDGEAQPATPGTPGDPRRAVTEAMLSPLPQAQRYGQVIQGSMDKKELQRNQLEQRQWEVTQRAQDRMAQIQEAAAQGRISKAEADERAAALRREMQANQIAAQKMLKQMGIEAASIAKAVTPVYLPQDTPQGVMAFNNRTGQMTPVMVNGAPVMRSQSDPTQQGALAGAKESGKQQGKAVTLAQINLPQVEAQTKQSLDLVDALVAHPGKSWSVGPASITQTKRIPGTPAADFQARLDQVKGQQFLSAFETLKGSGQITEVEGKKATDAISRMSTSTSIKEFDAAAVEYKGVVQGALNRMKQRAQPSAPTGSPALPPGFTPVK